MLAIVMWPISGCVAKKKKSDSAARYWKKWPPWSILKQAAPPSPAAAGVLGCCAPVVSSGYSVHITLHCPSPSKDRGLGAVQPQQEMLADLATREK